MASPNGLRPAALAQRHGFLGALARYAQRSYTWDYVGLVLLLTAFVLIQVLVEPFHRMFSLGDIALQYPHAEVERVPVSWLFAYAGGIPLLVLALWAAAARPDGHKAHVTFLGLFISLVLTSFITDIVKNAVGRPRPDLIARCQPEAGTPAHALVPYTVCTSSSHHALHDGWRSFPSGHSSFAFSGLGYLSLFLSGQLRVFRPPVAANLAHTLLVLAPLLGAALVAISRCEDYRHDVYDVTAGGALGAAVAWFTYRRYYPRLADARCDEPYERRGDGAGKGRARDEEESGAGTGGEERVPLNGVRD